MKNGNRSGRGYGAAAPQEEESAGDDDRDHLHTDSNVIEKRKSRDGETGSTKPGDTDRFSWCSEFRKMQEPKLVQDPLLLVKLIKFFNRNVSSNVNDCLHKKPNLAAKSRDLVKETLPLFLCHYRCGPKIQGRTRAVYLEQMSDLLAMYIDLELLASKNDSAPQFGEISSRIVTYLCIYLDNSEEHLLETIIKVQLVSEKYSQVLDPVISKVLRLAREHPETGSEFARQLLVYRLWRRVLGDAGAKKRVNTTAFAALRGCRGSRPDNWDTYLREQVLPRPRGTEELGEPAKFCLCQQFDLRQACTRFLRYCRLGRGSDADEAELLKELRTGQDGPTITTSRLLGFGDEADDQHRDVAERDHRLKSTLTPEPSKNLESVDLKHFSKTSETINLADMQNSLKDVAYIPLVNSKTNGRCGSKSNGSSKNAGDKQRTKSLEDVVLIDLTDDGVTKIIKRPKASRQPRERMPWLEALSRVNVKMREAALKKEREAVAAAIKLEKQRFAETLRSSKSLECDSDSDLESNVSTSSVEDCAENLRPDHRENSEETPPQIQRLHNEASALRNEDETLSLVAASTKSSSPDTDTVKPNTNIINAVSSTSSSNNNRNDDSSSSSSSSSKTVSRRRRRTSSNDSSSSKLTKDAPVNSNETKTDYNYYHPSEQKVQQEDGLAMAKSSSHRSRHLSSNNNHNSYNESRSSARDKLKAREKLANGVNTEPPLANGIGSVGNETEKEHHQDAGGNELDELDGLTLLATLSARMFTGKREKLKVKPYSSLAQPRADEDTEQAASNECVPPLEGKPEVLEPLPSYIPEDPAQTNLDCNPEGASAILNGETVMLLQTAPNSNYFIINKAGDPGSKLIPTEQLSSIKHELDVKPDPDALDLKLSILDEAPKSVLHYAPAAYPAIIHHSSAACTCANCAYYGPPPVYYAPAPSQPPVQTSPAVQEQKRSAGRKTDSEQPEIGRSEAPTGRFQSFDSQLPLKKRLRVSMDFNCAPVDHPVGPMMSIADVASDIGVPQDIGAMVEVSSEEQQQQQRPKSRATRKQADGKGCSPRKIGKTGKRSGKLVADTTTTVTGKRAKRTSKRALPVVNYAHPEVDPEWNPSGKRCRRKKTGR
ncbi:uncharacterized protein LOC106644222 [Copidosoma floridanum]|uniref:uncharacterized protein LOC106644222 n=1 Tax=Copidosoma floridanum TaxID=29053 RepID=UPI0006C9B092|nr:uncharacterized protein LOC106644222 [Copidosoma floridanum]